MARATRERSTAVLDRAGRRVSDDDDGLDYLDVPAAVLCARCGAPDCAGCAPAEEQSGIVAIVPWERDGAAWQRLWATTTMTTRGAEAFFGALPDGSLSRPLGFALAAEALATGTTAAAWALAGLGVFAALGFSPTWALVGRGFFWWCAAVPLLTLWMVGAHTLHALALERGAVASGGPSLRRRALRFGLYACGWDLASAPLGVVTLVGREGLSAGLSCVRASLHAPSRSTRALLRAGYGLEGRAERSAARAGTVAAVLIAIASALVIVVALAATL